MLFWSGRAFVLFRRMRGTQGWSSPPKRSDIVAKPSAFPGRRLCYLCAAPARPTPKIPFEVEEPVSVPLISRMCDELKRPLYETHARPIAPITGQQDNRPEIEGLLSGLYD